MPSRLHRTCASETLKLSGDSAARSSRIGTSTSRGEVSPFSNRTSVRVGLKSTPERAVPPLVLTVTLVAPRDPPLRVTSTNGVPLASPAVNAGALSWTVPACGLGPAGHRAAGRGVTGGSLSLAPHAAVSPRAVSPGPGVLRVQDERRRAGLVAAIVDRLARPC